MIADGFREKSSLTNLFARLLARNVSIKILHVAGQWLDVDNSGDLEDASSFI